MEHRFGIDVRWSDLDPYRHVNHAAYLAYCETARIAFLDEIGFPMSRLEDDGYRIVVVGIDARWLVPIVEGMRPTVVTVVGELGRVRSTWHQSIVDDDVTCFTAAVSAAFVDLEGRPCRAPIGFVEAATGHRPGASRVRGGGPR